MTCTYATKIIQEIHFLYKTVVVLINVIILIISDNYLRGLFSALIIRICIKNLLKGLLIILLIQYKYISVYINPVVLVINSIIDKSQWLRYNE